MLTEFRTEERAFGASTAFRVVASVQAAALASHLPRRAHCLVKYPEN